MTAGSLARRYVEAFCKSDIDGLASVLHPDLAFRGPLVAVDGARKYLALLRDDPPEPATFTERFLVEGEQKAAFLFDFRKPAASISMALFCRAEDGLLVEITLVFDPSALLLRNNA